jgi:hypothetical protein
MAMLHLPLSILYLVIGLRVIWLLPDWGFKLLSLVRVVRRSRTGL